MTDSTITTSANQHGTPSDAKSTECCVPKQGEPSFVLLGRDPQAPDLVERWATDRQRYERDSDKPAKARSIAEAMRKFKTENPTLGMNAKTQDAKEQEGSIPSPATKSTDAARPLGASGDLLSVQHGNAPLPVDTVVPEKMQESSDKHLFHSERSKFEQYLADEDCPPLTGDEKLAIDCLIDWMKLKSAQAQAAVPDGWVVVPKELTEEMNDKAAYISDGPSVTYQEHWEAMLATSPPFLLPTVREVREKAIMEVREVIRKLYASSDHIPWPSEINEAIEAIINSQNEVG